MQNLICSGNVLVMMYIFYENCKDLVKLLELVHLEYLVDREGGFDTVNDWSDVLSGMMISYII